MHIAKQSARGGVVLLAGNFVATALSAVASILIARLLGPDEYGVFSLAIVVPSLLQYFTHFGTRTAVTRYVAYYTARGELEKASRYAQASIVFSLVAGVIFTVLSYFASGWAAWLLHRPTLQPYIEMASFLILGQSLLLTGIAASTGWNAMGRASLSNILQAGIRAVASPVLIIIGLGVEGAIIGHAASFILAGLASIGLLYASRIRTGIRSISEFMTDTVELIRFGFSPFVANLMSGLSVFYISLLLSILASNATIGYYQAANSLIVPATLLATATSSALYPAFASLHGIHGDTRLAFKMSVKYVGYLIVPLLFFLISSSNELMTIIYGKSFASGALYLVLLSVSYLPILLGQSVIPYYFNGIGRPRLTLYATSTSIIMLFGIAPLLSFVFGLGVPGLIYSMLISYAVLTSVGLILMKRLNIGSIDYKSAVAVLVSGGTGLALCLFLPFLGSELLNFLVKFIIFGAAYLTLAPLLGALSAEDMDRLGDSLRGMPAVGSFLLLFVVYEKRLASLRKGRIKVV